MRSPHTASSSAAADDLARALGQMDQQRIFAREQIDGPSRTLGAALDTVDHQIADSDPAGGGAGQRGEARRNLLRPRAAIDRVVRACVDRECDHRAAAHRAQHQRPPPAATADRIDQFARGTDLHPPIDEQRREATPVGGVERRQSKPARRCGGVEPD